MSQTQTYNGDTKNANKGVVTISGAFSVNGASSPVAYRSAAGLGTTLPSGITSITRTGTGEYTITFNDQFVYAVGVSVDLGMGTAANSYAQFNGFTNLNTSSALTCKVTTITGGAAADIAAASNNEVWFSFDFKRTASV